MTAADLADWRTFWELDPWGEYRADLRSGSLWHPMLAPYLPKDADRAKVSPLYPYFDDDDDGYELDPEECLAFQRERRLREAAARAAREAEGAGRQDDPQSGASGT